MMTLGRPFFPWPVIVAMSERYKVRVTKDYLVFCSGHFISYEGHRCERLHGHNYRAAVEVVGPLEVEPQQRKLPHPPRPKASDSQEPAECRRADARSELELVKRSVGRPDQLQGHLCASLLAVVAASPS